MRNDSKAVSIILRIGFGKVVWIFKFEVLDKSRSEYEEAVPGECLSHAHSPPHTKWDELVLLLELVSILTGLKEPLWFKCFSFRPDVRVLPHRVLNCERIIIEISPS